MGMNVGGPRKGARAEINITPLIDVVLVLLIIFMVLVPSSLREITAAVPRKVETEAPPDPRPPLLIKVVPGKVLLDDRPLSLAELPGALRGRLSDQPVFFEAHAAATY